MKPGIKSIAAGAVLFLLGAFVFPLLVILPLFLGESNEVRFRVPGSVAASVEKPGRYYLWNDFRTVYEGRSYNRSEGIPDGIEIRVHDAEGQSLEFVGDKSISSSSGSSSRNSIGYVQVGSPGQLKIEVSGGNEDRIFSFSQSGLLKMFGLILVGGFLSVLAALCGFGLIVWGTIKLVKSKKNGERNARPNGGPAALVGNPNAPGGPPPVG
jgi:hypothetical protein